MALLKKQLARSWLVFCSFPSVKLRGKHCWITFQQPRLPRLPFLLFWISENKHLWNEIELWMEFVSPRNKENKEALQQFWNALNGFAAKCNFEGQVNNLIYDIFALSLHNKAMQERLCTAPKGTPDEMLQFAVAFEEGLKRQASNENCKLEVKSKPISVSAITKTGTVCFRCGAHMFTSQHIPQCKTVKDKCRKCGNKALFAHFYCKFKTRMSNPPRKTSNALKRINFVAWDDSSDGSFNETTGQVVLAIGGVGEAPFIKKGRLNINKLTANIDSCSPVTIFTTKNLKDILSIDALFARPLSHWEKSEFQPKTVEFCRTYSKRSNFAAANGRSLLERDWLAASEYHFKPSNQVAPIKCFSMTDRRLVNSAHSS